MEKMFSAKRLSLGGIKEKMENATQEFNTGWRNITDKAKKEAKIVNKKARKALELEDGGNLREEYLMTVNLDASHNLFKRFQNNWAIMHENCMTNVKKADYVDNMINSFAKDYQNCSEHLNEFQGNLLGLPEVLARVEIAQSRIGIIGQQVKQIEGLLIEYEDACERLELEKQKIELKVKLSQLVETKHAEYTLKKSIVYGKTRNKQGDRDEGTRLVASPTPVNTKEYEKQNSLERQKAYQDAFLDQMNEYIKYGELEKPIAGSANEFTANEQNDNIEIGELDLSTLREFLGPEEINSVLQATAAQNKTSVPDDVAGDPGNIRENEGESEKDDDLPSIKSSQEAGKESTDEVEILSKVESKDDSEVFSEEPVVDIAEDTEPCVEKKSSAGSDEEFFDAASENE